MDFREALASAGIAGPQFEQYAELAAQTLDRIMESDDPGSVGLRAMMLRAKVAEHQAEVSALLAEADLIEHTAKLAAFAESKRAELAEVERAADAAREAVGVRVGEERQAADRARTAVEYARRTRETAADLALADADPEQQTDAMLRRDAAAEVARQTAEAATWATQARAEAERQAEEAGEVVRRAKAAAKAADQLHADAAASVRPSEFTLALDWQRLLLDDALKPSELPVVRGFVSALAAKCGADQDMKRRAQEVAQVQAREDLYRQMAGRETAAARMGRAGTGTVVVPPMR